MKCVCPMGGDRTCPDDCPLAVWASLSPADRKAQRKPVAEKLYKQGFTQEQIATQLGVSQSTIRDDLTALVETTNVKGRGTDTLGRKKSTGRPKESKRPQQEQIVALDRGGVLAKDIARETGISERSVHRALQEERIKQEAEAQIDPATLSMSAKEKFNAAIRQHKRKLDLEFMERVREGVIQRCDEAQFPYWGKRLEELRNRIDALRGKKGLMSRADFMKIWSCLHPDSRKTVTDTKLQEAFGLFEKLRLVLVSPAEEPTPFPDTLPRTHAEWMKRRQQTTDKRRAQRANAMANR